MRKHTKTCLEEQQKFIHERRYSFVKNLTPIEKFALVILIAIVIGFLLNEV